MLAAIQAPIIMMSQNRQDKKDRLRSELDFDVNRRAETEIQGLANKMNLLGDKIADVEDLLRSKLSA
jgi:CRP/FNR family transcriptional regulator, cyclic AMP receptor protein